MLERRTGDILAVTDGRALVKPVNCAGAMGRGLAKAFADRYPRSCPTTAASAATAS